MERAILTIHPKQHAKLAKLAMREHVSTAEINRRAIDAYEPDLSDDKLVQLIDAVIQSNVQTTQVIEEAHKAIRETFIEIVKKQRKLVCCE